MKALVLLLITFFAVSSFAYPVQFLKNSRLPKQLQTLTAQTLAYDCPGLINSDSTVEEQETVSSRNDEYGFMYSTSLKITNHSSYKYMPKTVPMTILSSIYSGQYNINSYRSRICNSINN